jgi:hypothetical protein
MSILVSSCDEVNKLINPSSDEYLIDKTISTSSTEQIVESGTEFKMIFPANSVKGDFTLKIKKEGSYPTFSIPNAKLGSNTYRIKFTGNTAFTTPVKIIINYEKSQIPDGKTAAEFIQAYIYANGNWKLATYQLDEPNSKIIISISNLETPKTNKDKPEFLGDGDLVIGSGPKVINDSGQDDGKVLETLLKTLTFGQMLMSSNASVEKTVFENGVQVNSEIKVGSLIPSMLSYMFNNSDNYKMTWSSSNTFSINTNRNYEDPKYEGVKFNDTYSVSGGVSSDGKLLYLNWTLTETETKQVSTSSYNQTVLREKKQSFGFANLPLSTWVKDESVTYELAGLGVKNLITHHTYTNRFYETVVYSDPSYSSQSDEELSKFLSFDINANTRLYMTFYCR